MLEIISVAAVLVVLVVVLARNGIASRRRQFSLDGVTFDGVTFGIVLAVLGFVGFESSASVWAPRRATRTGPSRGRSLGSAVLVGVLYVFATYASVLGFGGAEALARARRR